MSRTTVWWGLAFVASVPLAVVGIWMYARNPGVGTYQANGWLLLPFVGIVLWWLHKWLPTSVQWVASGVLLLGGISGYLVWHDEQWWNYGQLATVPFCLLLLLKAMPFDPDEEQSNGDYAAGYMDGPWGPP